jgi:intracellular septation protein A
MSRSLYAAFVVASPRLTHRAVPLFSVAIYVAIVGLWIGLFARAFHANNFIAWSSGVVYIVYDSVLLMIVASLTWPLLRQRSVRIRHPPPRGRRLAF